MARWLAAGDDEMAELERRNTRIERDAAQLERDRAALVEQRSQP
jgi:cell division protein FtsB